MQEQRKIYSVSELTRRIRSTLEHTFGTLWVEGEVSNVRRPASGHCYFTLKDETAQLSAVLFRGDQRRIAVRPEDGLLVRAHGAISVYERSGDYQIIVRALEEAGKGSLQARFEKLKAKLHDEGLFDEDRKKPLPMLPQHVGVVTSATGAAIRDILNVVSRRFPNLHVRLAPVKVQGEGAAREIADAIDLLNEQGQMEVVIVGRGGGSLEDLWCFNEEVVARAIARSRIPVISAVGHEIDFTISDFVSDLRAPTPSAAAELVVGRKETFEERLADINARLGSLLQNRITETRGRLRAAAASYVFREPGNLARQYAHRLDTFRLRMEREITTALRERQQRMDDLTLRLRHEIKLHHQAGLQEVRRIEGQLAALNPLAVLNRGYSVTRREDGRIVRRFSDVQTGDTIITRVAEGQLRSDITAVEKHAPKKRPGTSKTTRREGTS